ncbi:hypothetical protein EDB81DRAFT_831413, partial [Dactylonectria macrodidyma]
MGQLCGRESGQDPTPNARVSLPDFTSTPHDKGKERQPQGIAHQSSIRIVTQDDDAPHWENATDCNMTFYFTSYPNTKSKNLSDNSRNCLKSLRDLWGTDSWKGAVQLVAGASILETELGIQKWLNNEENFAKGETEDEKHVKLLGHVREKMLPYWHGWHQRDLNAESQLLS